MIMSPADVVKPVAAFEAYRKIGAGWPSASYDFAEFVVEERSP
jgi:hypothetical protein